MSNLELGTLQDILAANDTTSQGIVEEVKEWGVAVKLRGLTRGEVQVMTDKEGAEREVFIFSTALLEPKVTEDEAREILESKGFAATQQILNRVLEVSGLTDGFRQEETG